MTTKKTKKESRPIAFNTIYDDVYRTMAQKMSFLFLPAINEMFGKHYSRNTEITQLRNEYFSGDKKVVTDSIFQLPDRTYHIECQSSEDGSMAVRMFEYDTQIAFSAARMEDNLTEINYPYGGVLYLRDIRDKTRNQTVTINFPDGQHITYHPKILTIQDYKLEDIFQKNLLLFLPYYILRYEKDLSDIAQNASKTVELFTEYQEMFLYLQKEFPIDTNARDFLTLRQLIRKVNRYVLRKQETLREGVNHTMGGKVIELYADKLERRGEQRGEARGMIEGEARGKEKGTLDAIRAMVKNSGLKAPKVMDMMGLDAATQKRYSAML